MKTPLAAALLFTTLPGCVAAIGNKGVGWRDMPPSARPLLQERADAARRVLELRQQHFDFVKTQAQVGRSDQAAVNEAEIAVEEARIRLLEFRAELQAVEKHKPD